MSDAAAATLHPRARRHARALGSIVIAVSLLVLVVGWYGGVEAVRRVLPTLESMKANTAVGLLALGLVPVLLDHGGRRWPALLLGGVTATIGVLTAVQYVAGVDLGIDELLVADPGSESFPGRPGLNTAIAFVLLGCASVLATLRRRHAAQVLMVGLVVAAVWLSGFALLGYLYGVTDARGLGSATEMALHTSLLLVLASAALAAVTATGPPLAVLWSEGPTGRLARSLLLPGAAVIVVAGMVAGLLQRVELINEVELQLVFQATMAVLVVGGLTLLATNRLHRVEAAEARAREDAEAARAGLAEANRELERRVARRTSQLRRSVVQLEATNDELERFARAASHDLKEPLRMVSTYTSRLLAAGDHTSEERLAQYGSFVREGVTRMEALIDGVRLFTEVGAVQPADVEFDVDQIVRGVVDGHVRRSGVGGPAPSVVVEAARWTGEPVLVRLALSALVDNALRYGRPETGRPEAGEGSDPDGLAVAGSPEEPWLHVRAHEVEGALRVAVADRGPGVREDERDRIFELFTRLHHQQDVPGAGVGLAVGRRAAERLGGRIEVADRPGGGAVFTLVVPHGVRTGQNGVVIRYGLRPEPSERDG